MRCNSCGIEIPPIFSNSLKTNVCPACSGAIMHTETQELIDGLTTAMEKMPNNPQGIACWLASNYKMIKINDYDPIDKFYDKAGNVQSQSVIKNSDGSIKGNQQKLQDFFARAGVNKSNIEKSGAGLLKQKKLDNQDVEDLEELKQDYSQLDPTDKMILMGSGDNGAGLSGDEKDVISSFIQNSNFGNDKEMNAYYQKLEQDKLAKQDIILGGGATSRTGKPAGFRRA